jgi:hypothetical protein
MLSVTPSPLPGVLLLSLLLDSMLVSKCTEVRVDVPAALQTGSVASVSRTLPPIIFLVLSICLIVPTFPMNPISDRPMHLHLRVLTRHWLLALKPLPLPSRRKTALFLFQHCR